MATNPYDNKLFDLISDSAVVIHSRHLQIFFGAGCWPDILDFGLSKDLGLNILTYTLAYLSSNHNSVIFHVRQPTIWRLGFSARLSRIRLDLGHCPDDDLVIFCPPCAP